MVSTIATKKDPKKFFFIRKKVGGNIQDEQIATIADHTIEELVSFFFRRRIIIAVYF
jgi:hypothetical protein